MKNLSRSHLNLEMGWCVWLWEEEWCRFLFLIKWEGSALFVWESEGHHARRRRTVSNLYREGCRQIRFWKRKATDGTSLCSSTVAAQGERSTPGCSTEMPAPVISALLLSYRFQPWLLSSKIYSLDNLGLRKVFVCCMNMSHRSWWSAEMFPQNFRRVSPGCKHAAECLRACSTAVASSWDAELIHRCWKSACHSDQRVIMLCIHAGMLPPVPRAEVA